jgi:cytochrome c5
MACESLLKPNSNASTRVGVSKAPIKLDIASEDVMKKWSRSCALCHLDGAGGAPRVGVAKEWRQRLAQGKDVLMMHAVEGFNNMPPLGYCMSCEREDFAVMIDFMSGDAM